MKLRLAIVATLRSRRFWVWQLAGIIIYSIPVLIRYGTSSNDIPILNFPGVWIDHFIPGNLLEKVLVNAFFPGGAGAVAGKAKYLARLSGALGQTGIWSLFQFWGYSLMISGPGGGWNLFEHPVVFPINFMLATLSIFTSDFVGLLRRGLRKIRRRVTKDSQKLVSHMSLSQL
jgi:hypothetical protein